MEEKLQDKKIDNTIDNREDVATVLSLLEHDENVMSDVQKEVLEEEISELAQIKEDQINIAGIYAFDMGEKIEVKAFIRNGLSKNVSFEKVQLVIKNSKNELLASQLFNLESLGKIPARSARPVKLYFEKKNVFVDKIPMEDWNIMFDTNIEVVREIKTEYENLPSDIGVEDKLVFDKFLNELPKLEEGTFSISTFSIGLQSDGNILVTLIMRNASNNPIKIEKLPMTVKDAAGNAVKSNVFQLDNFSVAPFKARICNFAFPTGVESQQNVSLNNWSVEFKL